jgi:hypothetical protein
MADGKLQTLFISVWAGLQKGIVTRDQRGTDKTVVANWFSELGKHGELWEEAVQLGSSARVLTLLSWSNYGK